MFRRAALPELFSIAAGEDMSLEHQVRQCTTWCSTGMHAKTIDMCHQHGKS